MQVQQSSRAELMRVLKVLDQALAPRTFLVEESITLADMAVATAVLLPFKYVCMYVVQHIYVKSFLLLVLHVLLSLLFSGIRTFRQEISNQCY